MIARPVARALDPGPMGVRQPSAGRLQLLAASQVERPPPPPRRRRSTDQPERRPVRTAVKSCPATPPWAAAGRPAPVGGRAAHLIPPPGEEVVLKSLDGSDQEPRHERSSQQKRQLEVLQSHLKRRRSSRHSLVSNATTLAASQPPLDDATLAKKAAVIKAAKAVTEAKRARTFLSNKVSLKAAKGSSRAANGDDQRRERARGGPSKAGPGEVQKKGHATSSMSGAVANSAVLQEEQGNLGTNREALSRLVLAKQKELLRLKMQAKEKELAQLRSRFQEKQTAPASLTMQSPASPHVSQTNGRRRQGQTGATATPSSGARAVEASERVAAAKTKTARAPPVVLSARVDSSRSSATTDAESSEGAQPQEVATQIDDDEPDGREQQDTIFVVDSDHEGKGRKRAAKATLPSPRSRSRSLSIGGASDDSEIHARWRAQEALWRQGAVTTVPPTNLGSRR